MSLTRRKMNQKYADGQVAVSFVWKRGKTTNVFLIDGPSFSAEPNNFAAMGSTQPAMIEMFHLVLAQCLFETVHKKNYTEASESDLDSFLIVETLNEALDLDSGSTESHVIPKSTNFIPEASYPEISDTSLPSAHWKDTDVSFTSEPAGFFKFDIQTHLFVPVAMATPVRAIILLDGTLAMISDKNSSTLFHSQALDPQATTHVDRGSHSFVWCRCDATSVETYSLRFDSPAPLMAMSNAYGLAVYNILNSSTQMNDSDKAYLLGSFLGLASDVDMENAPAIPDSDSDSDSDSESPESEKFSQSEDSESESEHRLGVRNAKKTTNRQLAIGYKDSMSFVSHGDCVSVFRNNSDDGIKLAAQIEGLQNLRGASIEPSKMMLHQQDSSLLLIDKQVDENRIYKMDLELGKIVEEWQIHPSDHSGSIETILPETKYAQMSATQTIVGIDSRSIFRIDPRLNSESKRVESEKKSYAVKTQFTCGATTGVGDLAVGSGKGEIRLYDQLDKRAKTLLPGFGDPIIGIDVTEGGRFIVATCSTYLLFFCTEVSGELGFSKPMGQNKPIPKRLQLKPEHVLYMKQQQGVTGESPILFTPARFNTGVGEEERAIITSTGPFVVTWNLRRVKLGHLYDYQLRRYDAPVVADNFSFGHDRSILVTLPNHVTLLSKKALQAPTPSAFGPSSPSKR